MMHAILDKHGYVVTLGEFDVTTPSMVEVPTGVNLPFLSRKIRHTKSGFEVTQHPALPPMPHMTWSGQVGAWIDPRTDDQKWSSVRTERDRRIAASDWVVLPDVSMSSEAKQAWLSYRQALRDVTNQPDPTSITWPSAPV